LGTNHVARIERQLAMAQQITHTGSWEWDVASGAVTWSDELYRIYGLERGVREITVGFFFSRLHPDDRETVERGIAAALERGGRFQWLERVVRPDGSIRELDTVGDAVRDEYGRVTGLIGTCRDITDEIERSRQLRLHTDIFHNVQIGLSVWSVDPGAPAEQLTLKAYNHASEEIAARDLTGALGKPLSAILPYAAGGSLEALLGRVARERHVEQETIERLNLADQPRRALSIKGFPLPGRCVGLAVEDITAQTLARHLQSAEHRVLEMIARGAPLADALNALTLAIEEQSPPAIASVLLLDRDGQRVRHGAAPNLPAGFRNAIEGSAIGPRAGSCGTAAFRRETVVVRDIEHDELWEDWRTVALEHGLQACWSVPILATDKSVLGTFAFYYREPRAPGAGDLEVAERASRLAGIAIERKQLEGQLRDLSAHVEATLEEERRGIAREIHDELGQALTALKLDIAWIRRRTSSSEPVAKDAIVERLTTMSALTDQVIQQVRRISAELRPGVLDDLGLVAAIEWLAQDFEERTGTTCVVRSNATDAAIDRHLATAAFRIFQEALTNVTRHAEARHVEVRIEVTCDTLSLEVRDDGVGISAESARSPRSLGLLGIRERAHRFGGTATVGPGESQGTVVSLRAPLAGAYR
jgi:PAS domain S-box-containing protein